MNSLVLGTHGDNFYNDIFPSYTDEIRKKSYFSTYLNVRDLHFQLGKSGLEKKIEEEINSHQISHIFILSTGWDFFLDLVFCIKLQSICKITMFFFDTEYYFENHDRYYAQAAHLVVLPDLNCLYSFKELQINCITTYALYSDLVYKRGNVDNYRYDVAFIGNLAIGQRRHYIDYLKENGINVYTHDSGPGSIPLEKAEMLDVFRSSKINLNFSGLQNLKKMHYGIPSIRSRFKQSKGRPIEIALCGGFILSEKSFGISSMFEIDSEIDVFSNKEELLAKINFYLNNENLRISMLEKSYKRASMSYSLDKGFNKIINEINKSESDSTAPVCTDMIFLKEYWYQRFLNSIRFLFSLKIELFLEEVKIFVYNQPFPVIRLVRDIIRKNI